jgi:hypothetical protein
MKRKRKAREKENKCKAEKSMKVIYQQTTCAWRGDLTLEIVDVKGKTRLTIRFPPRTFCFYPFPIVTEKEIYLFGGKNTSHQEFDNTNVVSIDRYTRTKRNVGKLPANEHINFCVCLDQKIVYVFGETHTWKYDICKNKWYSIKHLENTSRSTGCIMFGRYLYVFKIGDFTSPFRVDSVTVNVFDILDEDADWVTIDAIPDPTQNHDHWQTIFDNCVKNFFYGCYTFGSWGYIVIMNKKLVIDTKAPGNEESSIHDGVVHYAILPRRYTSLKFLTFSLHTQKLTKKTEKFDREKWRVFRISGKCNKKVRNSVVVCGVCGGKGHFSCDCSRQHGGKDNPILIEYVPEDRKEEFKVPTSQADFKKPKPAVAHGKRKLQLIMSVEVSEKSCAFCTRKVKVLKTRCGHMLCVQCQKLSQCPLCLPA